MKERRPGGPFRKACFIIADFGLAIFVIRKKGGRAAHLEKHVSS
jgi:hypothetical protein